MRRPDVPKRLSFGIVRFGAATAALCSLMLIGASRAYCFPWSIDMYRGPAVQPLEAAPRVMPSGTLPVTGGAPPMNLEQMTIQLHNPLKPAPEQTAKGRVLFENNCAPCHGLNGEGNGSVKHLLQTAPANLITGASLALPDGYIYGYIRDGGFAMPSYDDAMSSDERWQVVMYVRLLQQRAAARGKPKTATSK